MATLGLTLILRTNCSVQCWLAAVSLASLFIHWQDVPEFECSLYIHVCHDNVCTSKNPLLTQEIVLCNMFILINQARIRRSGVIGFV